MSNHSRSPAATLLTSAVRSTLSAALLLALLCSAGCSRNPVTGKRELTLISESQEIAIGQESHPQVVAEFGTTANPALQAYFSEIGHRLARISQRPNLPWTFTVVDVPLVNAFAVPGGFIYLTRGILAYMNSEAELAGVLGHEIGHVTARHSVTQISRAQLYGLGLGLGSVFSPTFQQLSPLAEMGVGLLFLKYGRDDERQSDQLGIEYVYRAGYDPRKLSEFFKVFEEMSPQEDVSLPDWLSSHPSPPDRIAATSLQADELILQNKEAPLLVNREAFLNRLSGIVFGEDPREGFSQQGSFLHPDLQFRIDFPTGWKVQNTKSAVVFTEPSGRAAVQLTLAPSASASPQRRAQQIAEDSSVVLLEGQSRQIHGSPAYLAHYRIQRQGLTSLDAYAAFIHYQQRLYQLVGLAETRRFSAWAGHLERTLTSFRNLRDRRALQVQPDRLELYRCRAGETLAQVHKRFSNPRVSLNDLALLNRLAPNEPLAQGTLIKVVQAGRR